MDKNKNNKNDKRPEKPNYGVGRKHEEQEVPTTKKSEDEKKR